MGPGKVGGMQGAAGMQTGSSTNPTHGSQCHPGDDSAMLTVGRLDHEQGQHGGVLYHRGALTAEGDSVST